MTTRCFAAFWTSSLERMQTGRWKHDLSGCTVGPVCAASALKTSLDYDGCHWRFSAASDFRTPEMVQKKIVYERKFEEVSEYLDMLLYAFVKEEKVERALVNVDAAMVDGPMRGVLQKAIDHMHMTFDETDVMRDSLQMIEREYACSRIKNVHDFIVHVEIYGGAIERPVELLLADKKRWEQRICGSMKERRKMFVDIVMSIAASLLICGMILYLPVMEIDISKNLISQVLTIVVVILDDLIFTRAQKYLAIDWLALDGHTDEADAKKIEEYYRYDERKEKRLSVVLAVVTAAGAQLHIILDIS